jgi:hypothetical protein
MEMPLPSCGHNCNVRKMELELRVLIGGSGAISQSLARKM